MNELGFKRLRIARLGAYGTFWIRVKYLEVKDLWLRGLCS